MSNEHDEPLDEKAWKRAGEHIATMAREYGYVVTIEQRARQPLAMGNHEDVVTVRPLRTPA